MTNLDDELKKVAYLWLTSVEGLGIIKAKKLLSLTGGIDNLWNMDADALKSLGMNNEFVRNLINSRDKCFFEDKLANIYHDEIELITVEDKIYPAILKQISDNPFILYAKGNINMLNNDILWIGMVGTRRPSPYGAKIATKLSKELSSLGVGIVSGMAKGIDGICHKTALKEGANTIAVLGNGCNIIYPNENKKIYYDMVEGGGVVISEFEPNQMPLRHHFPRRNRIISGLSNGVVIVEAGEKSGSLITARYALDQGRTVMVVPENVTSHLSKGGFRLLRDGAVPVCCAEQIIQEFDIKLEVSGGPIAQQEVKTTLEKSLAMIEPATADQIAQVLDVDVQEVLLQLTYLEIKGRVFRKSGGVYLCSL